MFSSVELERPNHGWAGQQTTGARSTAGHPVCGQHYRLCPHPGGVHCAAVDGGFSGVLGPPVGGKKKGEIAAFPSGQFHVQRGEELFPFDGGGGFAGDVVGDTVNTGDLINDAVGYSSAALSIRSDAYGKGY